MASASCENMITSKKGLQEKYKQALIKCETKSFRNSSEAFATNRESDCLNGGVS